MTTQNNGRAADEEPNVSDTCVFRKKEIEKRGDASDEEDDGEDEEDDERDEAVAAV